MIIGLTGGSGTGKSTASAFFRDSGFAVADLDAIARTVCAPGTACLAEIDAAFGGVVDGDGELNRHKLGDIVFNDGEKLKLLNSITHKYIIEETKKFISKNCFRRFREITAERFLSRRATFRKPSAIKKQISFFSNGKREENSK